MDDRGDPRTVAREQSSSVGVRGWFALATGLNVAVAVCYLMCKAPSSRTLSMAVRARTSVVYLLLACIAGVAGTWISLPRESRGEFRSLLRCGMRGWVFLPAIVLFMQRGSVWAMLLAVVASALMAVHAFRTTGANKNDDVRPWVERGLFATEVRLAPTTWVPFGLSVCLYGAFAAGVSERIALASLLLAVASFLFVLEMIAARTRMKQIRNQKITERSHPYSLIAAALFCAFVALSVPGASGRVFLRLHGAPPLPAAPKSPGTRANMASGYQTIVLWPAKKEEKAIRAPHLKIDSLASGEAKRWVIPFYGPYWYFKFAGESPGPNARTTKGDPLKVNVFSTDRAPLLMEAHQHLDEAIDMDCCKEIQVMFRNDVSLGAMGVGILLSDSSSPGKRAQMLGMKFVEANPLEYGLQNAAPVEETLTFLFPKHAAIKKFDEITVMLLPDGKHTTTGRRVAVERFVMVPN